MANKYGIFFSYNGAVIRLPINPETLPQEQSGNNASYNVLGIGDITVPRLPQQKQITISSYFPGRVDSSVLTPNNFLLPEEYIKFFRAAMNDKRVLTYTPVRYLEDGSQFASDDVGFKCTVESFNVVEKGGETGDFYYDLVIKEYKDYSPQEVVVQQVVRENKTQSVATKTPTRETPKAKIVVGSTVIANGNYYYSSWGDEPHGTANGMRVVVSRIVDESRACPYLIYSESGLGLGWISRSALSVI